LNQKIYVVTKNRYFGHRRTLGFFRFQNNDLYYDFGSLKGSHNSYHRDGSQWRTSLATRGKPKKEKDHIPLKSFNGLFNLGTICVSKNIINKFPKTKQKYYNKYITYEVDLDSFPSEHINIVCELLEPNYIIPLAEEEKCYPPEAVNKTFNTTNPWLSITLLGHENNLLIIPGETGFKVNHFNERFTANKEGQSYSSELYSGDAYDKYGKEI